MTLSINPGIFDKNVLASYLVIFLQQHVNSQEVQNKHSKHILL